MLKSLWAKISAKKTIKAMCDTYKSAKIRNPHADDADLCNDVIQARYKVVPLDEEERRILDAHMAEMRDIVDACMLVILAEAGIPLGTKPSLERHLRRVIASEVEKHLHSHADNWDKLPRAFVDELRHRLGEVGFARLGDLARTYGLFGQQFLVSLGRAQDSVTIDTKIMMIASLLTSMGNELARDGHIVDALDTYLLTLALKPDHHPARASLAITHFRGGNIQEARTEAKRALEDMDKSLPQGIHIPPDIGPPEDLERLRELLAALASGNLPECF